MNFGWLMAGVMLAAVGTVGAIEAQPEFNRRATATAQILAGITPNPADPVLNRLLELRCLERTPKVDDGAMG